MTRLQSDISIPILKTMKSIICNKNNLKSSILKDLSQPHGLFPIAINKKIKEYFPYHNEFEIELIKNYFISNVLIPNIDEITYLLIYLLDDSFDTLDIILKNSHNDIANSIINEKFYNITEYTNRLKPFKWSIKKPMNILYFLIAYRYPEKDLNIIR